MCASFLVERIGRRILFISSCIGMLVFFTLQTACAGHFANTGSDGAAHAVIAFIFLFYAAYNIAFSPLIVSYTVEILPYNIRAKGLSIFNFTISVALIFNQYVNPIALDALGWKYYVRESIPMFSTVSNLTFEKQVVYCVFIAFETVYCYLFIVETKNRSLEETAALFDGEDAAKKVSAAGHDVLDDHAPEKAEISSANSIHLPDKAV